VTAIEIVVPAVPDKRASPNARNSERNRKKYRKALAMEVHRPCQAIRIDQEALFPIAGPVTLDVLVRWPKGRNTYGDRQNIITMLKEAVDVLQTERLIVNDRDLSFGSVEQERATGQEETVLTLRWEESE
jgi:Holliday junction resolvase RusA-like endonuclease